MHKVIVVGLLFVILSVDASARQKRQRVASVASFGYTCEAVRSLVASVGLSRARALAQEYGLSAAQRAAALACLRGRE